MQLTSTSFDFNEFARTIYREVPHAHQQPFLLPALYGGALNQSYEALFVLEEPSVPFTEKHWKPCHAPEIAIQTHREIFLKWAYRGKQAHLFSMFEQQGSADCRKKKFFARFYVTDIWKDAAFKHRRKDQKYMDYWVSKLASELENIPAKRVVFIGEEAKQGRQFVRDTIPAHFICFPHRFISNEDFKREVTRLTEEIRQR